MFADNTAWSFTDLNARVVNVAGTANSQNGSAADDTFVVDHRNDTVVETADAGTDTVRSSVSFQLPTNVENLTLTGSLNATALGNDGDNVITGNAADNVLDGRWGIDTLVGGTGNDTYRLVDTTQYHVPQDWIGSMLWDTITDQPGGVDTLVTNLFRAQLPDNVENLRTENAVASGIEFFRSGDDASVLDAYKSYGYRPKAHDFRAWYIGNTQDNIIDATGGGVTTRTVSGSVGTLLDGGEGADTLIGGTENDWYVVDNPGDVVIETGDFATSYDVISSSAVSLNAMANIEVLELTGDLTLNATGDANNNDLRSSKNSAVNVLTGKGGDDIYVIDTKDIVVEAANGGTDTVIVDGNDYRFWKTSGKVVMLADYANVENIAAVSQSDGDTSSMGMHIVGTAANNTVGGSRYNDILEGGAGDDVVEDSGTLVNPNHTYLVGDIDSLYGGDGNDTLISWSGNDLLDGGNGDDTLNGGSGNDVLDGGVGNDVIVFGIGDGHDTVRQLAADANASALNVLRFNNGVLASDVVVKRWGSSIEMTIASTGDSLLVEGFYLNNSPVHANNPLQRVEFFDGTNWSLAQLQQLASVDYNTAPPIVSQPLVDGSFAPGLVSYTIAPTAFTDADAQDALRYNATLSTGEALPAWLRSRRCHTNLYRDQ
ncbi:MAG: hypothetical protein IPH37_09655 [Burkholderiales bacterium]|nr:hypothetical protein [Burkholderiales bacterium]